MPESSPSSLAGSAAEPILSVRDLRVRFRGRERERRVVDGISFDVHRSETLALVGESGCGKSTSALALVKLVPEPPGKVEGQVWFAGQELIGADEKALRGVRGRHVALIFQEPASALNPVLTLGRQVTEGMRRHLGLSRRAARQRAIELFFQVGLPSPQRLLTSYPHELSGGQRQRVMIAIALSCEPEILLADEATTALDVTIQAEIVDLIARLQEELGMAVLWISHDLAVVGGIADRVLVMYGGRIVEEGPVSEVYERPWHPYTEALLRARPHLGGEKGGRLPIIDGQPPDPEHLPSGCVFNPRCPYRQEDRCQSEQPSLTTEGGGRRVACFYPLGDPRRRRAP